MGNLDGDADDIAHPEDKRNCYEVRLGYERPLGRNPGVGMLPVVRSARPATAEETELFDQAEQARENSYAEYSGFQVGAALRTTTGEVMVGANFENASYGLTICAERSAVAQAVAKGLIRQAIERGADPRDPACLSSIAIAASAKTVPPCGACRQVLAQFAAPDMRVVYPRAGALESVELVDLLPDRFKL